MTVLTILAKDLARSPGKYLRLAEQGNVIVIIDGHDGRERAIIMAPANGRRSAG